MPKVDITPIETDLPQSILDDNPEERFTEDALGIMRKKYLLKNKSLTPIETPKERIIRVAQTMARPEMQYGGEAAYRQWLEKFYETIAHQDLSPGGRIWSNAGTSIAQLFNCFVFPQFDTPAGVMQTLTDTALTHKEGGGTGFNFSVIPPKGMASDGFISPGAVLTINNTDVETETICQGNRRGANMGVVDFDYPDILDFLYAKRDRRETKDKEKVVETIVTSALELFDRARITLPEDQKSAVYSAVRKTLDDSLLYRRDAKKVQVVVQVPQNLEAILQDGFFPLQDPLTNQQFTASSLKLNVENVEKNKAALGPESITPLSVKDDKLVSNYTGKEVGKVVDGKLFMNYQAVVEELAQLNIPMVLDAPQEAVKIPDDLEGIFNAFETATSLHIKGQTTWLDFSGLRAKGSPVRGGAAISSGPRSFVRNYDTEAGMYSQQPEEPRNNKAVISLDHPDMLDVASLMERHYEMERPKAFVFAVADYLQGIVQQHNPNLSSQPGFKEGLRGLVRGAVSKSMREAHKLKNFNVSVNLEQTFVKALEEDGYFPLKYKGQDFTPEQLEETTKNNLKARAWLGSDADPSLEIRGGKIINRYNNAELGIIKDNQMLIRARTLFDLIVENAHATGDPGLLLSYNANKGPRIRSKPYRATNPCGEIWLGEYEPCDLASINLANMIMRGDGTPRFDGQRLHDTTRTGVRFLDNVHDANQGPIPEVELASHGNRRTGLGIMGWANLLAKLKIPYDSERALELAGEVGKIMAETADGTSYELALEKGAFPNFHLSTHDQSRPLRNIATRAIAPTGTISMIYDVNSAIEPFFALAYKKFMRGGDSIYYIVREFEQAAREFGLDSDELIAEVSQKENHGSIRHMTHLPAELRNIFGTAHDISPVYHVKTQEVFQGYMDNAVSKTINLPRGATVGDVKEAYLAAINSNLKGITAYRDGSRDAQILVI